MNIDEYIAFECERQHTTNVEEMRRAFDFAAGMTNVGQYFAYFVMKIAYAVDPQMNCLTGMNNIRKSEVGFANGGSSLKTIDVQRDFDHWVLGYDPIFNPFEDRVVDLYIKRFLDIHPFADGNGRTASILRNWLLNTMDDPTILPYYYGKN